jgi:hypothetical protein
VRSLTLTVAVASLLTLALQAAGARPVASGPARGGVYRVAFESSFEFSDGLDPTGEYLWAGMDILSNLLVRTLVGYNHVVGPAGNKLVPNLATSVPAPTDRGRTYTFHLKPYRWGVSMLRLPYVERHELRRHELRFAPVCGRRGVRFGAGAAEAQLGRGTGGRAGPDRARPRT